MFSSKTKSNQSSVTSDVINTTTLLIGGADTSLGYQFDASYNMTVSNDLIVTGKASVLGVRNVTTTNVLYFNTTSKEITYGATSGGTHGCLFYTNSTFQSIANNTYEIVNFNTTNSSRNVAISGFSYNSGAGTFTNSSGGVLTLSVTFGFSFSSQGTGMRQAQIQRNGSEVIASQTVNAVATPYPTDMNVSAIITLNNTETIMCKCVQTSGGALPLNGGTTPTYVYIYQL